MSNFVDDLKIKWVDQYESTHVSAVQIQFQINDSYYHLEVRKENGKFRPKYIAHQNCSFCSTEQNKRFICETFKPYMDEIFHRLIEMPSIRLNWLFLENI